MVCGGCQVAPAEGMMGPQEGKVTGHPPPRISLVQWLEASLMRNMDTKRSPELEVRSPSRLGLGTVFGNPDFRSP